MATMVKIPRRCRVKLQDCEIIDGKRTGKWKDAPANNVPSTDEHNHLVYVSPLRRAVIDADNDTAVPVHNSSSAFTLKLKPRKFTPREGRKGGHWESAGIDGFVSPGRTLEAYVGKTYSLIIEELPS